MEVKSQNKGKENYDLNILSPTTFPTGKLGNLVSSFISQHKQNFGNDVDDQWPQSRAVQRRPYSPSS